MNKNIKKSLLYTSLFAAFSMLAVVFSLSFTNPKLVEARQGLSIVTTNTLRPLSTTTLNYMTAGTATTTLALYTENTDQVGLNILLNASSSATILKWRYEYSIDGVSWFPSSSELSTNATTTVVVRDFNEYSWTFASSTAGSSSFTGSQSYAYKHVDLKDIASFYTRIVFYIPTGSTPGAIYVQAVNKQYNSI